MNILVLVAGTNEPSNCDTLGNAFIQGMEQHTSGASITKLRASGSPLTSSNTVSSGPTPFAKIIDVAIRAIQRGGKKKGGKKKKAYTTPKKNKHKHKNTKLMALSYYAI